MKGLSFIKLLLVTAVLLLILWFVTDKAMANDWRMGVRVTVPLNFTEIVERGTLTVSGELSDSSKYTSMGHGTMSHYNSYVTTDNDIVKEDAVKYVTTDNDIVKEDAVK